MTSIEFSVDGLPPIKRGSQSMWGKQIERIKPLRAAAAAQPHTPATLEQSVHLRIVVLGSVKEQCSRGWSGLCRTPGA